MQPAGVYSVLPTPFAAAGNDDSLRRVLDGVFLLEELRASATGTTTRFAYPEILVQIVSLHRAGNIDEAAASSTAPC